MNGFLFLIFTYISFFAFYNYHYWCFFEPNEQNIFPEKKKIYFETFVSFIPFMAHIFFNSAGHHQVADSMFWICVGSVIASGVFTPISNDGGETFFSRIIQGIWLNKFQAFILSFLFFLLDLFIAYTPPVFSVNLNTIELGFFMIIFVSILKVLTTMSKFTDKNINFRIIILRGLFGVVATFSILLQSPSVHSKETESIINSVFDLIFLFVGAVLRI